MPNEREDFNVSPLTLIEYEISGNFFRAYYDADKKLVCVLDYATTETKPNVLLVINPVGARKWDDILMNDYGLDLETVRPKKDNKYQKLDIEYFGLGVYDALFRAYNDGDDITGKLTELYAYRNNASRNSALERLGAADVMAKNARETIEKAKTTIAELQERLKDLRARLVVQRKEIGKEPTKQSASKILRTEAQIDAVNEKMARAKKRLVSAQRRLVVAEDDADVAHDILDALEDMGDANLPMLPESTNVAVVEPAPVPMTTVPQFSELTTQTKAEDMADEEVKPLFEKDPNILDENIAFKPIDFNAGDATKDEPVVNEIDQESVDIEQPLSFVPPVSSQDQGGDVSGVSESAPVLDSLTAVPNEKIDSELMATIDIPGFTDIPDVPSESEKLEVLESPEYTEPVAPAAVVPEYKEPTVQEIVEESAPTPMPEIEVAPTVPDVRPVSPVTGTVSSVGVTRHKPTKLSYLLLVLLIVLSVFTLWFYQKSTPDVNAPALDAKVEVVEGTTDVAEQDKQSNEEVGAKEVAEVASPFIADEVQEEDDSVVDIKEPTENAIDSTVVEEPVNQPEVVPSTEIETVVAADDANVVDVVDIDAAVFPDVEPVAVPVVTEEPKEDLADENVVEDTSVAESDSPFLSDEVVAPAETKSVAEIIASKPVYNVSQQEKMFVADEEYETDATDAVEEVVVDTPVVDYSEPAVVEASDAVEEIEQDVCSDGNAPDMNGCCAGETFVDGMCCADGTDECFPPM